MSPLASSYTFGTAAAILGVNESKLRYWSQIGFVGPSQVLGGKQAYSFQDLVSARAAKELVERGFGPAEIRRALDAVRHSLPAVDRPLDRLRVAFDGDELLIVDQGAAFEPNGQRVFDFSLDELAARASAVDREATRKSATRTTAAFSAFDWFTEGLRLEGEQQLDEASAAYRQALHLDAGLSAAHTNLGALLHRRGDVDGARAAFESALASDPDQVEARYNLAHLLFEQGEVELAASELRRVVDLSPQFADAHYNLATALEQLGSRRQAREHLERYLALVGDAATDQAGWISEARTRIARL